MLGLFKRRYEVSAEICDWIEDSFDWAQKTAIFTPQTPLILPTKEFFPAQKGEPDHVVKGLVENLKPMIGVADLDISVAPLDVLPDELRHQYGQTSEVAGTWQGDFEGGLIRYDPTLIRKPMALIAMLAHELMHQRMARTLRDWPGGDEVEELTTDLCVIAAGLGAIQIAGSDQAGWQGYLRQTSRAHALAVFLTRQGLAADPALNVISPRLAKQVKRGMLELAG